MTHTVAINGFGRIGRLVFRHIMESENELEIVAINDIAPLDNLAYLLRFDSVHAKPKEKIGAKNGTLQWGSQEVRFLSERDPANLPWEEMEVDLAIEASGLFTKREEASKHLKAGAGRVLVTAPAKGADFTVCMGVNDKDYKPEEHKIVSNASCTTNCLAPVAKVLDENFGIETGFLTTVHAYTSSQAIVDAPNKKMRRGRSAAVSIVPTTTGAAIATTKVLPQLEGKMDGLAMRVPVVDGSIIDFVAETEKPVTVDKVNQAFRQAAQTDGMKGVLGITDDELVSTDIVDSTYSALVDAQSTMTLGEHTVKVLAWYDNEWGYSRRVADLAAYMLQ
ncbi:MAG: type I glyceraldehyde-3-phosphate dehydrogenase [Anaerolineales bacterium]|jgi:glyceraldehyde 3-phosphate dehydrogenase